MKSLASLVLGVALLATSVGCCCHHRGYGACYQQSPCAPAYPAAPCQTCPTGACPSTPYQGAPVYPSGALPYGTPEQAAMTTNYGAFPQTAMAPLNSLPTYE